MQSSGRMRAQITTLIITTSLTQFANGFFGLDAASLSYLNPASRTRLLVCQC